MQSHVPFRFGVEMSARSSASAHWVPYVVALAAVAAALAVRWSLDPWLGGGAATIYLFGAIVVAVWFGGYRPGILAAVAG